MEPRASAEAAELRRLRAGADALALARRIPLRTMVLASRFYPSGVFCQPFRFAGVEGGEVTLEPPITAWQRFAVPVGAASPVTGQLVKLRPIGPEELAASYEPYEEVLYQRSRAAAVRVAPVVARRHGRLGLGVGEQTLWVPAAQVSPVSPWSER